MKKFDAFQDFAALMAVAAAIAALFYSADLIEALVLAARAGL